MFKALIGRGHVEFSTNRQQDAQEFFAHLLECIDRAEVRMTTRSHVICCDVTHLNDVISPIHDACKKSAITLKM